jgi:hypothetical protein
MNDRTDYHRTLRAFAAAAEALAKAGEELNAAAPPREEPDDEVSLGCFALALGSLRRLDKPGYRQLFMHAANGARPIATVETAYLDAPERWMRGS